MAPASIASALLVAAGCAGCFAEAWVGAERQTLDGQRGTGWVAGASVGTFWGAESPERAVIVNGGLATTTRRGGPLERSDADGVHARLDLMATSRLGLTASGDLGWVRTLARDGMTLRQRGRLRGGAVGLAYDAIRRPYNTGTLSLAATYARWDDLPVALTAVGAEVRFRWLWASPLAFACNPTDCYEGPRPVEGPGLTGAFLNYTPSALPTPAGAPPRTCRTVETCSSGRFGMRCSSSTECS
ncbi:MAG: hypothetical protein IPH44_09845 [Myxococcales bacterium]|mgnify:CR=1 FL=1|nr:hypothetical protein [Myxococcales bacterium]MBK7198849.1 hypothetical protein [Myxococcales bacterium]MBP6845835.1 hypothetical protein [Kofleriaceae bacterium]